MNFVLILMCKIYFLDQGHHPSSRKLPVHPPSYRELHAHQQAIEEHPRHANNRHPIAKPYSNRTESHGKAN